MLLPQNVEGDATKVTPDKASESIEWRQVDFGFKGRTPPCGVVCGKWMSAAGTRAAADLGSHPKRKQSVGLDCLVCATFARQRSPACQSRWAQPTDYKTQRATGCEAHLSLPFEHKCARRWISKKSLPLIDCLMRNVDASLPGKGRPTYHQSEKLHD